MYIKNQPFVLKIVKLTDIDMICMIHEWFIFTFVLTTHYEYKLY
jgi:hypothetical protein